MLIVLVMTLLLFALFWWLWNELSIMRYRIVRYPMAIILFFMSLQLSFLIAELWLWPRP